MKDDIFKKLYREFGKKRAKELLNYFQRICPFEPNSATEIIDYVFGVRP